MTDDDDDDVAATDDHGDVDAAAAADDGVNVNVYLYSVHWLHILRNMVRDWRLILSSDLFGLRIRIPTL